jgi:polyphosphate:AMP phosphotransferase
MLIRSSARFGFLRRLKRFPHQEAGTLSEKPHKQAVADLRLELVNAQYRLMREDFSVLVLLGTNDRMACEQVIDRLHAWMDARHLDTWFGDLPTEEEKSRPTFWRYWRAMPPKGRIGLFAGAWMITVIGARLRGKLSKQDYKRLVRHSVAFDRTVSANGTLIVKIWIDVPRKTIEKRLRKAKSDPDIAMLIEAVDWEIYGIADEAEPIIHQAVRDTGTAIPWTIVDDSDENQREIRVAELLLNAIREHEVGEQPAFHDSALLKPNAAVNDHLAAADMTAALEYKKYKRKLSNLQVQLHELSLQFRAKKLGCILVFEGWDAAGKGGVIRRITQAISARDCKTFSIAAPTDEELAHHYLWRFWRHIPRDGHMAIFDRSWYGRVLVERVENLASAAEWTRAYAEINDFESQIIEHGTPVIKFWLHIDPDEQMRRFKAREETPYKKYKLTEEDYRNRERWPAYTQAVNEMIELTSTKDAIWHVVPAIDKRWARIQVLETVCDTLKIWLAIREKES